MNSSPLDPAAVESLLAFWRDAGVDACFEDSPVDRTIVIAPALKAVARATASVAPAPKLTATGDALADAHRMAAAADDFEALAKAVAAFDGCELKQLGARQAVFGRGDPSGSLLIVGEGPGAEEDLRGQPFVGKAGKLLDQMLTAAGLLDQAFITNTVFWRPPGNRTPTPQEQAVCAPFVERVFQLMRPKAVLLLGAAAARSILRTEEGIMKTRGRWSEWRTTEGDISAPALPTLHPAFLLRQPQAKKAVWSDLLSLAERLDQDA